MKEQVNANEVIAELQSEIAEKALQIALLKTQLKEAKKPAESQTAGSEEQGDEQ